MQIPLQAHIDSRDGTLTKSPFLRNGYVLKDGDKLYVEKRPGLRLYDALGSGVGRGLMTFIDPNTKEETLFPITGSSIYQSVDSFDTTRTSLLTLGTLAPTRPSFWVAGDDGTVNNDYRMQNASMLHFGGLLWAIQGFQSRASVTGTDNSANKSDRSLVYYSSDNGKNWTAAHDVADGTAGYPESRCCCSVVWNNKMYILGGREETGTHFQDVWSSSDGVNWTEVNASVTEWGTKTPMRACVHNGEIYVLLVVVTGSGFRDPANVDVQHSADGGLTWTSVTTKPWTSTGTNTQSGLGWMFSCGGNLIITEGARSGTDPLSYYTTDNGATAWGTVAQSAWKSATSVEGCINAIKQGGSVWVFATTAVPSPTYSVTAYYTADGITWNAGPTIASGITITDWRTYYNWPNASSHLDWPCNPAILTSVGWTWMSPVAYDSGSRFDTNLWNLALANAPYSIVVGSVVGDKFDAQQVYDLTSMMIKSNTAGYVLDTVNFTLSRITDADYPAVTVRGCVYLNGIFYVMDPDGTIWGSDEDDPTSWTATNFVSAEFEPDGGVAIAKLDSYLVAFGNYTTEQFWDAGNASGSTLSPVTSTPLLVGCANGDSVQEAEGALIWAAQAKSSGQGYLAGKFIAQLQGNNLSRISTPSVDKILEADGLSDVDTCVVAKNGQTFYVISLHTAGVTLAYHLQAKRWYPWTQQTAGSSVSVSSITRVRDIATVTTGSAHGYSTGDLVEVAGANQSGYNKVAPIVVTSTTTFTYLVNSSTTTPATGTITCQKPTAGEFTPAFSCNFMGMQLTLGADDGNVYEFDADTFEDNGEFIDFRPRTDKWDGQSDKGSGNMRAKFPSEAEVIGDKISADAYLRWSDDDFANWTGWRRIDLSLNRSRTHRLGNTRRRSFELLHTANTRARFERLELDAELGV